jgi:osmotically inducible lipoprotein OsmB
MLSKLILPTALAAAIAVSGCSTTTERTVGGAAIGAGTGAAIGAVTGGSPAAGAVIGGAAGAIGGLLYDQNERSRHRHYHHY